jgi:hypothetical protein
LTTSTSSRLFALLALAAGLRFFGLGWASLQVDEAMSWLNSAGYPDVHPPLFGWLLHQWARLGGSEAWLRTLPVLCALLGLGLWARVSGSLLSVLLLATSFAQLQQDREVRMYALLQLLAVAYFGALLSKRWVGAGVALLGACFTHLFGLFLFPLGWFWACRRCFAMQAVVLLIWLSWGIPHYRAQLDHPLGLRQVPSLSMEVEAVGRLVTGRVAAFGDPWSVAIGALVLGWLAWRRPRCAAWVYGWALGPWLGLWLVSRLTPLQLFEFKYLVWTLPAWTLLLAERRLAPLWLVVNLGGAVPWLGRPHESLADWRRAAHMVSPGALPVVVHPSMMGAPLLYYGLTPPRLRFVDEAGQIPPGALIWVTTPHHPFVVAQALQRHLRGLRGRTVVPAQLPSSVLEVSLWEGEKQGR